MVEVQVLQGTILPKLKYKRQLQRESMNLFISCNNTYLLHTYR